MNAYELVGLAVLVLVFLFVAVAVINRGEW